MSAPPRESRFTRTLIAAVIGLRDWALALAGSWNAFWFTPADPAPLCLLRLLAGGMILYSHIVWGMELEAFVGPNGWNSAELIQRIEQDNWAWSFWWSVPTDWFAAVHAVCLVVLGLFWLGCWTRITSILAFAILVSYSNRAAISNYGLDQISSILALYLMIGPSGAMYSVDSIFRRRAGWSPFASRKDDHSWRKRRRSSLTGRYMSAGLALRLIQVHYCIIYFFSGLSKLQGQSWWTGEAMWRVFANYEYQSTDMTWLAAYPWLLQLMTIVTLWWEISFAYLIWNPRLRPWLLAIGVAMHLGIGACLGMWTFGLMMMFGYVAFLDPRTVRRWMSVIGFQSRSPA